jgi:hypothetical protein
VKRKSFFFYLPYWQVRFSWSPISTYMYNLVSYPFTLQPWFQHSLIFFKTFISMNFAH